MTNRPPMGIPPQVPFRAMHGGAIGCGICRRQVGEGATEWLDVAQIASAHAVAAHEVAMPWTITMLTMGPLVVLTIGERLLWLAWMREKSSVWQLLAQTGN